MWHCYYCRTALPVDVLRKNRMCPNCGSDIHCCKNCVHYDESSNSKCKEPESPWVRDRASTNSCTLFEFHHSTQNPTPQSAPNAEAEKAKQAFRALFRDA